MMVMDILYDYPKESISLMAGATTIGVALVSNRTAKVPLTYEATAKFGVMMGTGTYLFWSLLDFVGI